MAADELVMSFNWFGLTFDWRPERDAGLVSGAVISPAKAAVMYPFRTLPTSRWWRGVAGRRRCGC
jgi:hypothetical protein